MARERIEIPVSARTVGKHHSRAARKSERVPGVVYGPKTEPINVLADELTVKRYQGRKFESTIFNLKSDDSKLGGISVILRDVQVHPVTRRPVHVDFYAPDMSKPVRVAVQIQLEGKPAGTAEGGLLEHLLREVEIEVLPNDIPEVVLADVSELGLNEALHVSDLKVPAGVKIVSLPTLTIATVSVVKEESLTPTPAAGAAAAGAAPAAGAAAPAAAPAKK